MICTNVIMKWVLVHIWDFILHFKVKAQLGDSLLMFWIIHIIHCLNSYNYSNYQAINPIIICYVVGHKHW
jgi:hypothetical protein